MEAKELDVYIATIKDTALEELPEEAEYFERQRHVDRAIFKAGMEEEIKGGTNAISYLTGLQDGEKKGMQKMVGIVMMLSNCLERCGVTLSNENFNRAMAIADIHDMRVGLQAFLKENGLRS